MAIDVRKYANVDQPIAEKIALRKEIEKSLGYIVAVVVAGDGAQGFQGLVTTAEAAEGNTERSL